MWVEGYKRALKSLRRVNSILLFLVLSLVALRIFLPSVVKYGLNWVLTHKLEHYTGHIADVDMALWRGAYKLQDLMIRQKDIPASTPPLISILETDISLSWRSLLEGRVLTNVTLMRAVVNFVHNPTDDVKQFGTDEKSENWRLVLEKIIPVRINNFKLVDSQVHFQNPSSKPAIDIFIDGIQARATNISNKRSEKNHLSSYTARAFIMGDAFIESGGGFNVLNESNVFATQTRLQQLKLVKLNSFFKYYGNVDVNAGIFDNVTEFNLKNNHINGYTKGFFKDVDVIATGESYNAFLEFVSEVLLASGTWAAKNSKTRTSAFYMPFEGPLKDPKFDYWEAAKSALKNGFSKPLAKGFESRNRYIE